jgi:hypothetical protein
MVKLGTKRPDSFSFVKELVILKAGLSKTKIRMRKFSTRWLIFLNIILLFLQWRCGQDAHDQVNEGPENPAIPEGWQGDRDLAPNSWNIRDLQ